MTINSLIPVTISGVGFSVPDTVITNELLSTIVDTNDEWILSRTGIRERRVVSGNQTSVDLCKNASLEALAFSGINPEELDAIIVATSLPDNLYPSNACLLQAELGAQNAIAFDVVAACSGLVYAMNIAKNFIATGAYKKVLIVGADVHSRFVDWTDRGTCILFGDGAGAAILEASQDGINDLLYIDLHADGRKGLELRIPNTGTNCPLVAPNDKFEPFVHMNGREIYKFAVSQAPISMQKAAEGAGLTLDDIDLIVPHQANLRIIEAIKDRLGYPIEKFVINLDKYGNTSTASIPIAITEAFNDGRLKPGMTILTCGFGAGLTWGSSVLRIRFEDKRLK